MALCSIKYTSIGYYILGQEIYFGVCKNILISYYSNIMIKQINDLEELKLFIEMNFRILDKKISMKDREIEVLIKKIKKDLLLEEYEPVFEERDIKVISYTDD